MVADQVDARVGHQCRQPGLFALYHGPWLDGEEGGGFAAIRTRLRSSFIDAINILADAPQETDPALVKSLLERALCCEPTAEIFYMRLMSMALTQGRPETALDLYARCRDALHHGGHVPGPRIEELYNEVINGSMR